MRKMELLPTRDCEAGYGPDLWALFCKTLCIFSKNKATLDKVSYGSGQKCSKELKNLSFTLVEAIVVQLE